ncbi:hypothetical protein DFH09DRAFT_1286004, partial [Mycena vulgaris]
MADTQTAQAPATIEINDALFCTHFKEVVSAPSARSTGREENDAFFGFDPIDRDGMEAPPAIVNKDGVSTSARSTRLRVRRCSFFFILPLPPPSSLVLRLRHPSFGVILPHRLVRPSSIALTTARRQAATSATAGRRSRSRAARTAAKKAGKIVARFLYNGKQHEVAASRKSA